MSLKIPLKNVKQLEMNLTNGARVIHQEPQNFSERN